MSLNFIYQFQLKIHQTLFESQKIKENVNNIYLSATQDGNYPFILINFIKIDDKSKKNQIIYSVDFEISIFSSDKSKKILLLISDFIKEIIIPKNLIFPGYDIVGIKLNDLSFNESKDLIHNKLTMEYKSMLKKEHYNEFS